MSILAGILIPFVGTALGAAMVFFVREWHDSRASQGILGLASGIMLAASVWSLLLPSIEMAEERGGVPWLPAAAGMLGGTAFLWLLGRAAERLNRRKGSAPSGSAMMCFAVTLHNLPEGMAVGIAFAGARDGHAGMTVAGAAALALGIAIQNVPEGAIISLPLRQEGHRRPRAFLLGVLSGAVEPLGAALTLLLTGAVKAVMPYLLAFAAGAMLYVVADELIPEAHASGKTSAVAVGTAVGFVLMMTLDVMLG